MNIYIICSFVLTGIYIILMLLYTYGLLSQKKVSLEKPQHEIKPFFSIVIPARNEAENIAKCLESILTNDYPSDRYEIILIDDFSEDETVAIAKRILNNKHKVLQLADFISKDERLNAFKKKALSIAIGQSRGEYIISTDADCIIPRDWLKLYSQKIAQNPGLSCIAAPVDFVPYKSNKNWLYYFQSLDFMTMQGITIASNRLNLGNMSNGANFLFSRKAFDAVGGYQGIDHKASGDDMMLMQKIEKLFPHSIDYLYNTGAIVSTPVQENWSSFLNQRIRWASKADSFPQAKLTTILLLVYLFNVNFIPLIIFSFFSVAAAKPLCIIFIIKVLAELIFVIPLSMFFKKQKELLFFILLQPLHILYIILAGFLGKFGTYTWKGRAVH